MGEKDFWTLLNRSDHFRKAAVALEKLSLPGVWIAGGMIRNSCWDQTLTLSGESSHPINDVDIIFFGSVVGLGEQELAQRLFEIDPSLPWSVKEQVDMAGRFKLPRPCSISQVMDHWVETATATGVTFLGNGRWLAGNPFGFHDLLRGILRPVTARMLPVMNERCREKGWEERWPRLKVDRRTPGGD